MSIYNIMKVYYLTNKKKKEIIDYLDTLNFQMNQRVFFYAKEIISTMLGIAHLRAEKEVKQILNGDVTDLKDLMKKTTDSEKAIFEKVFVFKQYIDKAVQDYLNNDLTINKKQLQEDSAKILEDNNIIKALQDYFNLDFLEALCEQFISS